MLYELLTAKGYKIKEVFYGFYGNVICGQWIMIDADDIEYKLGGNMQNAKRNISNNDIKKIGC